MIRLYWQKDCPDCEVIKDWFMKKNIIYETVDIDTLHGRKEAIKKGICKSIDKDFQICTTPVIEKNGKLLFPPFDEERIKKLVR